MKKKETKEEYIPLVPEKEKIKEAEYKHNKSKIYVGFTTRMILSFIVFFIVLMSSIILIRNSFNVVKLNKISVKETSNIDYRVYINKNDIYESDYLDKNMSYLTELINKIEIDLRYNFEVTEKSNFNFKYQILGDLIIKDKNGKDVYYKNTYILSDEIKESIKYKTKYKIDKTISLDYWYYNGLSNKFKKNYEKDAVSYLEVYLDVIGETAYDNFYEFNNRTKPSIKIPLSEESIIIDTKDISTEQAVGDKPQITLRSTSLLLLGIVLLIVSILIVIQIKLNIDLLKTDKPVYDKVLDNILREHDDIIVNTTTPPDKDNFRVINVKEFKELLDVWNQVKEPIKYYAINEHTKSEFYLNHNDEIYILTLKAVDLEQEIK